MNHNHRTKNPHRWLLYAGLFGGVLLLIYGITLGPFNKKLSTHSSETVQLQPSLTKDIQLDWPEIGQAAVGSVEDGLLARSSDNEEARPIASMAKVITALAIMEKKPFEPGQEGKTYTITREDIATMQAYIDEDGTVQPLLIGMELTQYQTLQRILIASDNNMADIVVERVFGSQEAYVSYANAMVKRMGLSQTVVADASGFNPKTVSTSSEMIVIGIAALKNPVIAEIVAQQQAELAVVGTITNTNELLGDDGVIGIKTGTTEEAGSCLLFAARLSNKDGQQKTIVGVIMGSADPASRFNNSRRLLESTKQALWDL